MQLKSSPGIYFKIFSISTLVIAATLVLNLFISSADRDSSKIHSSGMHPVTAPSFPLPNRPSFAGEALPMDRRDIRESLDREILVNAYWHSQTLLFIKRSSRFFPIIEPILKEQGVPDDFKYLALIESSFIPTSQSPAGAVGIWQFMKDTAKRYGLEVETEVDERYHIEKSTVAACKYLKEAYARFGNWTTAAASYNAGLTGITRQQTRQQEQGYFDLYFGEETARYVFRIVAVKEILNNPLKYGFSVPAEELYQPWETQEVEVKGPVVSFAEFAKSHGTTYKQIKTLNPWLREAFLTNKPGKTYQIKVPKE
ncbi:MAG: lytic transglycosylase domain-containing protein [Breznakibacter sp.]